MLCGWQPECADAQGRNGGEEPFRIATAFTVHDSQPGLDVTVTQLQRLAAMPSPIRRRAQDGLWREAWLSDSRPGAEPKPTNGGQEC
jgi:hypothetical protein